MDTALEFDGFGSVYFTVFYNPAPMVHMLATS